MLLLRSFQSLQKYFFKRQIAENPVTAPVQQEQSQTEKALALINTFATGDTDTARSLLSDGYIQHNLAYGTGADAFIGSVEYLASADVKTTVNNIRAFEDGDKVFLQTIYNFAMSSGTTNGFGLTAARVKLPVRQKMTNKARACKDTNLFLIRGIFVFLLINK